MNGPEGFIKPAREHLKKRRALSAGRCRETERTMYAENTDLALNSGLLVYASKVSGRVRVAEEEKDDWDQIKKYSDNEKTH